MFPLLIVNALRALPCPPVHQPIFRESGRNIEQQEEGRNCSSALRLAVQREYQNCSHSTSTAVYEATLAMEDPALLTSALCSALARIATACTDLLRQCFAEDDVLQMRRSSVGEMKEFLVRIVGGKVEDTALDPCQEELALGEEAAGTEESKHTAAQNT